MQLGSKSAGIGPFGYCTDALPDLVRAALAIVTGAEHAQVVFDGEPHHWGLAIEPAGLSPNNERIVRMRLMDAPDGLPRADGRATPVQEWATALLEGYVTADDFGRAIVATVEQTLSEFGNKGYQERWGYFASLEGFPRRGLNALKAALATPEVRD